jgi:7-cyano-7-deazaguanine reductase
MIGTATRGYGRFSAGQPYPHRLAACIHRFLIAITHMSSLPSANLTTFANPRPNRDFIIRIDIPEFTCLCPMTGQPDFAKITLEYVPADWCVELKSLKLYMWTFRDRGAFHEAVTNEILDHLVAAVAPRFMRIRADFNVRGGLYTRVVAEHRQSDWQPPLLVQLTGPE